MGMNLLVPGALENVRSGERRAPPATVRSVSGLRAQDTSTSGTFRWTERTTGVTELTTAPGPILLTGGIASYVMLFLTSRSSRRTTPPLRFHRTR